MFDEMMKCMKECVQLYESGNTIGASWITEKWNYSQVRFTVADRIRAVYCTQYVPDEHIASFILKHIGKG